MEEVLSFATRLGLQGTCKVKKCQQWFNALTTISIADDCISLESLLTSLQPFRSVRDWHHETIIIRLAWWSSSGTVLRK